MEHTQQRELTGASLLMQPELEQIGHLCESIPAFPMHVFILCHFSSVVETHSILKLFLLL